jgi:hypothetical protein
MTAPVLTLGTVGKFGASILAIRTRSRPQRMVSPSWTEGDRQRTAAARTMGMTPSLAPPSSLAKRAGAADNLEQRQAEGS